MRLSFMPNGARGTPALLFSQATPAAAAELRNAVEPLMAGISRRMPLHEIPAISVAPGLTFAAAPGSSAGVRQLGPLDFVWEETLPGWLRVYDLLEPFTMPPTDDGLRVQQLHSAGAIAVILSTGDTW